MRLFYKFTLKAGAIFGALLFLSAALLIAEPQWFLTARTVARAARFFGGAWHPRWKTLAFEIRSLNFREKQIRLQAGDFCFENVPAGLEGCLKELDVRLDLRLYFFGVKPTKIHSLVVSGDHFNLDRSARGLNAPAKKRSGLAGSLPALPDILRGLEIGVLKIDLPENRIVQAGGEFRGRLGISLSAAIPSPLALNFELERSSGSVTRRYVGEADLNSDILRGGPMTYLDASGSLKSEGVNARFKARVEQSGPGVLAYSVNVSAKVPARRLEADLRGSQEGQELFLSGSAGVWESTGPVKSVRLGDCAVTVRLKADSTEWDAVKFSGDFTVEPKAYGAGKLRRNFVKTLEGRLTLSARSTPKILAGDHFDAEAAVTVKPVKDWYEFYGGFEAALSGRLSRLPELKVSHKLDFGFKVLKFEDLVELLAHTPYSVPAPLNVLRGPIGITLKGGGDSRKADQDLNYVLSSGLAAGRQAFKFEAAGKIAATGLWSSGRSFKDETDLVLQDVALQLPRIDIKGMSSVTPDSRIKTGAESDKAELVREKELLSPGKSSDKTISAEVRVKTAKPLILYSNLAMDPVPIALDLNLRTPSGGVEGTAEIRRFRAKIFRRVASIDHVKISGRAGAPAMDIDGLIVYQAAEAKISIRLLGTTKKPRVELESNPPMSQADIMAMLLFGKSPAQLDSDQQSSAANAQTAVSNSAFGLASLYLLASTPVDYVGYDPVSKTYTVKFRLPGGATLQVGSGGQNKGVQLRKRISSHLAIQTEFSNTQTQGNIVTTLLEWYERR